MHRNFAAWYNTLQKDLNAERLSARWNAVVKLAAECDNVQAPEFIKVFYSRPTRSDFLDHVREVIRNADPTYVMKDDAIELSVISAAVIAQVLGSEPSTTADALAGMIWTMEFGNRWNERITDIVEESSLYINREAIRVRESGRIPPFDWNGDKWKELLSAVNTSVASGDLQQLAAAVIGVFNKVATGMRATAVLAEEVPLQQTRYQEKSDMLWWLITERAISVESNFESLKPGASSFILARDLWSLTRLQPAPIAVPALLKKVLDHKKSISLGQAIDSIDLDWRCRWLSEITFSQNVPEICPCLCAVCKSVEAGGRPEWRVASRNVSGLDPESRVQPWRLAHQVYRELEVIKCLKS